MQTARSELVAILEQGLVEPHNVESALRKTGVWPTDQSWRQFIERSLTWLGILALSAALLFFIAYNWTELGRFARFAMVQLVLLCTILAYVKWPDKPTLSPALLVGATMALGVLMALYGQTYQTGADPWNLFFGWALLMLPWTLIGRTPVLWLIFLGLMNLAFVLYHSAFGVIPILLIESSNAFLGILFLINAVALVIWEWVVRSQAAPSRYGPRIVALAATAALTGNGVINIVDYNSTSIPMLGIYALTIAIGGFVYRYRVRDLFMLAIGALSLIIVVSSGLIRAIFRLSGDIGGLLIIAIAIMAMGAGAALWLRNVNQEFNRAT